MRSFSSASLVAILAYLSKSVVAQDFLDEILEIQEDPILDNDWPRKYETDFAAIREGATENNSEGGYWLDGVYTTLENRLGDLDLQVKMVLHNPKQEENFVYQTWMQIVDPTMSNSLQKVYEGYSAAIRFKPQVVTELNLANVYQIGYRGTSELQHAKGNHEELNVNDQTDDYPWIFDFTQSEVVSDETGENFYEQFVVSRDFTTTHSDIPLKAGDSIVVNMGYKVFLSVDYTFADKSGFVEAMEWVMIEKGAYSGLVLGLAASLVTLLSF